MSRSAWVDGLLMHLIRPQLPNDATVGTQQPADLVDHLPFVVARKVSGSGMHPRFATRASVEIDAFAASKHAAFTLCDQVVGIVVEAWEKQTVTPWGHISHIDETASPYEIPDQTLPEQVFRYHASLALLVRPN